MVEYADVGMEMVNAVNAVKQKTDYITSSNNEDGIAVEKFFL
jgi:hydroxymethylpyrimidine pyrophosphatase-like HAD family hydrolase